GLLLSGLVLRLRCHPSRVTRRVGHPTRYPFEALGLACLLATWSARSGPAEQQRLAPRPAPACQQELQAPRGQTPAWLGAGSDRQRPLVAWSARPRADPDWLSVGPARREDPRTPPSPLGRGST